MSLCLEFFSEDEHLICLGALAISHLSTDFIFLIRETVHSARCALGLCSRQSAFDKRFARSAFDKRSPLNRRNLVNALNVIDDLCINRCTIINRTAHKFLCVHTEMYDVLRACSPVLMLWEFSYHYFSMTIFGARILVHA